jgi:hypothetical protein
LIQAIDSAITGIRWTGIENILWTAAMNSSVRLEITSRVYSCLIQETIYYKVSGTVQELTQFAQSLKAAKEKYERS